jgi:amino acid adenylation domain-containing protein
VGIYIDRGTNLLVGLLSVLKTGAAYLPLDPIYPPKRIAGILEDARPAVLLTTKSLAASLPDFSATVICIDALSDIDADDIPNPNIAITHDDLAYVIFTSGSTGKPKGVQISHGALVNFLESMSRSPGLSADDVLLAVTTISFDIAGLELYLPLYVGARVNISIKPSDATVLLEELTTVRPTVMQATPATWQMLIGAGWSGDPQLKVLCGGEALEGELARSLVARSASVWNMYGPTETTIWSAALRVEDPLDMSIPIGPPIANTSFYILDPRQHLVPIGVAGELYIGGSGVAHGYLNRPDLTAERFVSDPFQPAASGARLYRTGDLVRYRRTGDIEFLGRIDHQVKLRGFRIELGEIEHSLRAQTGVLDAVVVLREDHDDKSLVGYLVMDQIVQPSETSLRDALRQSLPEYMLPRFLVFLEKFPRTPNGKLDRAALPAPERPISKAIYIAPGTEAERTVAEVFKELLQLDHLSVRDNFFELGAHSLLIAKAHDKLKHGLDPDLQLVDFFQYPTIEALAGLVGKRHMTHAQGKH